MSSSHESGTSKPEASVEGGKVRVGGTGCVVMRPVRGNNDAPVPHGLAVGAGVGTAAGFETTEVQPRLELPTDVAIVEGGADGGFDGRVVCPAGARRSASLPRLGGADDGIMDDKRGVGMRVSIRRISCTLMTNVRLVNEGVA